MGPKLGALCWQGSARVAVGVSSVCLFGRLQVGRTRFPVLRGGGRFAGRRGGITWFLVMCSTCSRIFGATRLPRARCVTGLALLGRRARRVGMATLGYSFTGRWDVTVAYFGVNMLVGYLPGSGPLVRSYDSTD
jgi:hypothetical protein